MPKYKDVEPILAKLEEFAQSTCDSSYEDGIRIAMQVINEPPAADVQKVKHGVWIDKGHFALMCSCCEEYVARNLLYGYKLDYCPKCGAKMDGKEQSNDDLSEQETPKAER